MVLAEEELARLTREVMAWRETPVLAAVEKGGSGRAFYRAVSGNGDAPVVVMHYSDEREENVLFVEIARFLRGLGVRVPAVLHEDGARRVVWVEDLGGEDLHGWRLRPWPERERLWHSALETVRVLHERGMGSEAAAGLRTMPGFDARLYAWERRYFLENFVERRCGIVLGAGEAEALEAELGAMAGRLEARAAVFVHRDFQSHNVMVRGGSAFLIDFQGMRRGAEVYDVASLLYDPYVVFTWEERASLLEYYRGLCGGEAEALRRAFLEGAAQRLMQALGAYGFLGLVKGKSAFLAHMRPGLENLIDAAERAGSVPRLLDLARRCAEALGEGGG